MFSMRSIDGQRSDSVAIKRSPKEKEMQLRQLREQLAGLKVHASPALRTSMEKKIAELESELAAAAPRRPRRD
jgi:hypothetical protein